MTRIEALNKYIQERDNSSKQAVQKKFDRFDKARGAIKELSPQIEEFFAILEIANKNNIALHTDSFDSLFQMLPNGNLGFGTVDNIIQFYITDNGVSYMWSRHIERDDLSSLTFDDFIQMRLKHGDGGKILDGKILEMSKLLEAFAERFPEYWKKITRGLDKLIGYDEDAENQQSNEELEI